MNFKIGTYIHQDLGVTIRHYTSFPPR